MKLSTRSVTQGAALLFATALAACGGGAASGAGGAIPTTAQPSAQAAAPNGFLASLSGSQVSLVNALAGQIVSGQLPDGAILNGSTSINGYFANYAAMSLVVAGDDSAALRWAQWYVAHLNAPNAWGQGCSMYDYAVSGGKETSTGGASSVDAHSASFLTLLRAMYRSGNPTLMAYVSGLHPQAECIALSLTSLIAPNGLAQVKPGDDIEYLIDNTQVFRGLGDVAWLEEHVWNDPADYAAHVHDQGGVQNGIAKLWNASAGMYASYTTPLGHIEAAPSWNTWYPDATAQLFPVINHVIDRTSPQAVQVYNAFNTAWPNWTAGTHGNPSGFPWAVVAQAAAEMGDFSRSNAFAANATSAYAGKWQWPWYDYESSSLIRAIAAPSFYI